MTIADPVAMNATEAQIRASIRKHQQRFRKARGSRALAELVADAFVLINMVWTTLSIDEQGVILSQHGIPAATDATSKYTPWIKLVWGEADPDNTVSDIDGEERPVWVPDRSMEIYHHTMEELEALGVTEGHADAIMKLGGAAAIAKKRKARLGEKEKSKLRDQQALKRKVFLAEVPGAAIELPINLPSDTDEFFTLLCRKSGSDIVVLGVADRKAMTTLDRMSADQYDDLREAADQRREAEQRDKEIQRRVEAAREEERQMLLVTATPEMLDQRLAELTNNTATEA